MKILDGYVSIDKILIVLLMCGGLFIGGTIGLLIVFRNENLIAPIGIILASFIASASLMKSITANKELKLLDHNREDNAKLIFIQHVCKDISKYLDALTACVKTWQETLQEYGENEMLAVLEEDKKNEMSAVLEEVLETWNLLYQHNYIVFLSDEGIYDRYQDVDDGIYAIEKKLNILKAEHTKSFETFYRLVDELEDNIDILTSMLEIEQSKLEVKTDRLF